MRNYCTIFDKNYLIQAIVLYRSLEKHAGNFTLYCLCMDDTAFEFIKKCNRDSLVPIGISDIENEELSIVRKRMTHGQFCWTCQPVICEYALKTLKLDEITYLESDSMFCGDPEEIFNELNGYSISIVPHRYTSKYDQTNKSGRYCVQFNMFKNNEDSFQVLKYWKNACFKYNSNNLLFYPGQTNIDNWLQLFRGVKEVTHIGAGVAPWNIQQYKIGQDDKSITVNGKNVIFYHFHQFSKIKNGSYLLGDYRLSAKAIELFYRPYIKELNDAASWAQGIDPTFVYMKEIDPPLSIKDIILKIIPDDLRHYFWLFRKRLQGGKNIISG